MGYKIPEDARVVAAIRAALLRHGIVNSQRKLTRLVLRELRREDPGFAVGEERIRRLAIKEDLATLAIHCRDSELRTTAGNCPVCGARMKRVRNTTVYGGTVTLGYSCPRCHYWTGVHQRIPVRYVFTGTGTA